MYCVRLRCILYSIRVWSFIRILCNTGKTYNDVARRVNITEFYGHFQKASYMHYAHVLRWHAMHTF